MSKALIFGASGQDAYYLQKVLEKNAIECISVSRSLGNWIQGDVADFTFTNKTIGVLKPDYIFHLAANSTTSHNMLFENHETISTGSLNILESVYRHSLNTKVFLSGSGLQFVNNNSPISENDQFNASSPYSIARIQSVYAARYYRTLGLSVYIGYFFNHDSPLRSEKHVNQKIVQAIKRIILGSLETIEIWDISIKKEFSFAGDIAEAIYMLIQNDSVFESVIGSGVAYSIEDWLDSCCRNVQLDWRLFTKVKPPQNYKKEYDILVSNPETIFSLGWQPKASINDLADIMLTYNSNSK